MFVQSRWAAYTSTRSASLPEEEQRESAPSRLRRGARRDLALPFAQPGAQESLGHPGHIGEAPDAHPWEVSSPGLTVALPSPGQGDTELTGGHNSPGCDTCLKYSLHLWFLLCPRCLLPSCGAGCDPIPWLGPKHSGNFPSFVCPNELSFRLCCVFRQKQAKRSSTSGRKGKSRKEFGF